MKALAYKEVDTQPGIQFSVQQVSMSIVLAYWNPVTGAWQSTPPTFAVGLEGGVRFRITNNLSVNYYFRGEASIKRPDGSSYSLAGVNRPLAPGASSNWEFMFTTNQAGTWQHNVAVYTGMSPTYMSLAFTQGWTDAAYTMIAAAGTITGYQFQNPETGLWQTTAPSLYIGQTLSFRGSARNDSGALMRARMDIKAIGPDGKIRTPRSNAQGEMVSEIGAVTTQADGEEGYWTFSVYLDEVGTWTVELIFYGELV